MFRVSTSYARHSEIWTDHALEFVPYVFQIFAALIEATPTNELPDAISSLFTLVLAPAVWETRGNVPGCARFLSAMIPKGKRVILETGQLEQVLGVFQRLLAGKKTESTAFDILESIVAAFDGLVFDPDSPLSKPFSNNTARPTLDKYFPDILMLTLAKLQDNASDSYKQRFTRFYHLVSARVEHQLGADFFVKHVEGLQAKLFPPIYQGTILKATGQFARPVDRKIGVISYTKTMCDSRAFAEQYGNKGWGWTANHLLDLLQNPPKVGDGVGDDIITEADVDDIGFGMGFTPLNTCKRAARDDYPEILDVQIWVSEYIKKSNATNGGMIVKFAQQRLPPEAQQALAPYLQ